MNFDGRVDNQLSKFHNKRKAVASTNPKCSSCGELIEEKSKFLFTADSKCIFCTDCREAAKSQLQRDRKESSRGQSYMIKPVLFEVDN